jgi:hypothetical protein
MCGEIDEEVRFDEELLARLAALAGRYGFKADDLPARPPRSIAAEADRHAYMDDLFRDGLARSLGDLSALPEGQRAEGLASQAIVLARLAGWLAGHLPPGADLVRATMEAMLDGSREPARALTEMADHHHGHEHHHHGHGHRH